MIRTAAEPSSGFAGIANCATHPSDQVLLRHPWLTEMAGGPDVCLADAYLVRGTVGDLSQSGTLAVGRVRSVNKTLASCGDYITFTALLRPKNDEARCRLGRMPYLFSHPFKGSLKGTKARRVIISSAIEAGFFSEDQPKPLIVTTMVLRLLLYQRSVSRPTISGQPLE